jgi:hypothetical protein
MNRRISTLVVYLLRSLFGSLAGITYIILSLAFYWVLFQQRTPEPGYFILVIGLFGGAMTFLATLAIAARANQALNFPFLVRLPSRVEYLTAVLSAALIFAFSLQLLVALLALLRNGPSLPLMRALEIPPIWLSVNILAAVMALHASDLVTAGWSRVYVYGTLAFFLFTQGNYEAISNWLSGRFNALSGYFMRQDWLAFSQSVQRMANWFSREGTDFLGRVTGLIFWPFQALGDAVTTGYFTSTQALAPAVLLLYATILFMLAADMFATKDLHLTE